MAVDEKWLSVELVEPWIKRLRGFLLTAFIYGFFLAIDTSDDVLTRNPWLQNFTAIMKLIVPYIERSVARSEFPQVTELYLSLSWLLSPLYLLYEWGRHYCNLGWGAKRTNQKQREIYKKMTVLLFSRNMFFILMLAICFFGYFVFFGGYDGRDFNVLPINSNRIALGLGGWLLAGGGVLIVGVALYRSFKMHVTWFIEFLDRRK